jgi:hypothetical protein
VAVLSLALLNQITPQASARSVEPPVVAQAVAQNSATWTITDDLFTSKYPAGFSFSIKASSSGGPVERARLIWNKATLRATETRQVYAIDAELVTKSGMYYAAWEPDTTKMLPPWSLFAYHWEFRDAAGNVFETEPVQTEYADTTHGWKRSESDDAIVFTLDLQDSVRQDALDALAQQRDKYLAVWGAPLPYRPRIVLFGDLSAWDAWRTVPEYGSGTVVGQTFDEWGVIAQVAYPAPNEETLRELAYATVPHETEHLYQGEFLSGRHRGDMPGWFIEGDATFFQITQYEDPLGYIRSRAADNSLPRLLTDNPADAPRIDGDEWMDGYYGGYTFFLWLEETTGGLDAEAQAMKLLGDDAPFLDTLEQVTGMTTDQIERGWRVWLGAPADPPTLVPTWTPPAMPWISTPTPQPQ